MKYVKLNILKGYKPVGIKYLAVVIGVCYLVHPLQNQISGIFHEISHIIEAPDTPIGHSSTANSQYFSHYYHEHIHSDDRHSHTLIDMLDSIFSASDGGNQQESSLVDVKFDKHLSTYEYPAHKIYPLDKNFNFVSIENNLIKGHSRILEEPPKSFSL